MSGQIRTRSGPPLLGVFFASGCLALAVQVMLLRELMVGLQGDETTVGLGLGAWLGGIALGASMARRLAAPRPRVWAGAGVLLLGLAGPAGVVTARLGTVLVAPPAGELISLGPALVLALMLLGPPGWLVGASFTALAATASSAGWSQGRSIARLYVLEALGSLAGGLVVTFLVIPLLEPTRGACLVAVGCLLLALPAARGRLVWGRILQPVAALALLALGLSPLATALERSTVAARFRSLAPGLPLVAWSDTPYQHVALAGEELKHVYLSGQYAGSFPDPSAHEAEAHTLACLAPRPGRILLLGGTSQGLVRHLLSHPVERIDLVAMDRQAFELVRSWLPAEDSEALERPGVRIAHDDPRRFLARGREPYDLILLLEPEPATLLLSRLSTVQFFRLCAERLAPDGVLVGRLTTGPNVLTGQEAAVAGSVYGALRRVFPVVRAGPGPAALVVAGRSAEAASLDPEVLARRYQERGLTSEVFVPELFPLEFPPARVAWQEAALTAASEHFPPSQDQRPVSFLHALALRQRYAGGKLAPLLSRLATTSTAAFVPVVLLPSLLVATLILFAPPQRWLALAATHAVAVTGACGMLWTLLILYSYQTRVGALYGQLGALSALFMAGLALGGVALSRAAAADAGKRWLLAASAATLAFGLVMVAALGALDTPRTTLQLVALHAGLLMLAGLVTGALFPAAAGALLAARRGVLATAGGLEAADHAAAALAALVGGVALIPTLGLTGTAWLLVALEAMALAALAFALLRARASSTPG